MTDIVSLQRTLYTSRNPTRRWLHTSRRDIVIDAIRRAPISNPARALEVGPGSGVYLPTLCERFREVKAIDIETMHIDAIRGAFAHLANLELIVDDLGRRAWPELFDLVLCSEVIEHVPDPDYLMSGLANAVRPDGILVLSTPQPRSLMELTATIALSAPVIQLTRAIYREPVLPTGHISVQSKRKMIRLLNDHGFEILESKYFGLYVPGIAEFGGRPAVSCLSAVESALRSWGLTGVLWTQMHIARKR